jgi:hypothetical protein
MQTALQPSSPRQSQGLRTIDVLSPGLKSLLTLGDNDSAIRQIAMTPALRDEASAVVASLEREANAPAGPKGVFGVISKRLPNYHQPERGEDEWKAWWSNYYDALADLPEGSIEAAMIEWVRSPEPFLPNPGQLRELALANPGPVMLAWRRAKAAMRYAAPDETPKPELTEDERRARAAEVRALADVFLKAVPEAPRPKLRANFAKTDETGISEELRARITKQRGEG